MAQIRARVHVRNPDSGRIMELRHVRYFSATLEAGSVVAAAAQLRVAQPALSRQIKDLEDELGVQLFSRERTGVRPTAAGLIFSEGARRLTDRLEQAIVGVRQAHEGQLGICRIAVGHVPLFGTFFGNALAEVRAQLPGIRLDVRESFGQTPFRALRADEIDIAVSASPHSRERGIRWETLYEDPVEYAILPAAHPLAGLETVDPEQLRDDNLLLLEPSVAPHIMEPLVVDLKRLGLAPQQYQPNMMSLYTLVAAGRGWTLGTRTRRERPIAGTSTVRLRGFQHSLTVALSWRSDESAPVVKNVINALRNVRDTAADTKATELAPRAIDAGQTIPAMLELRHLRAFVTAAEEGSLSRAAERLELTQSAVSRQIQELERITGGALLRRAARGVATTGAGEIFQREAATVLAVAQEAVARTRYSARGVRGRCVIGVVPTAMAPALAPALLQKLSSRLPDLDFAIEEMSSVLQARALTEGAIDIGVAHGFPGLIDAPGIVGTPMADDTLECALVARSHRLASRSSVTTADLADEPFLFVARSFHPTLYDAVMESFKALDFQPRINATYDGQRTLWALAATGAGWTTGTRNQCASPPEGLVALKIEGFEIPWGLKLLWRRDEAEEWLRGVIDALQSIVSES
ncbi:MAG TPA: LysR family transcriptional regulator, partial [Gemmatimonadaceae bacterium]